MSTNSPAVTLVDMIEGSIKRRIEDLLDKLFYLDAFPHRPECALWDKSEIEAQLAAMRKLLVTWAMPIELAEPA